MTGSPPPDIGTGTGMRSADIADGMEDYPDVGTCPVCRDQTIRLKKNDTLFRHWTRSRPRKHGNPPCPGTGKKPTVLNEYRLRRHLARTTATNEQGQGASQDNHGTEAPNIPDRPSDEDLTVLIPLQNEIRRVIHTTPIHLAPGGTDDLAAQLTLRVSIWAAKNVLPRAPGLGTLMAEVDAERQRQIAKWGDQKHPDGTGITGDEERAASARHTCQSMADRGLVTWRDISHEEHSEALAESDPAKLRAELIQDIAVKFAWIADIDSRTKPDAVNEEAR